MESNAYTQNENVLLDFSSEITYLSIKKHLDT